MAYDLNDVPRFTGTFKNASDVLTDPTVVTFTYTNPAGTATTLTYGTDVALVKSSTGVYYVDLALSTVGRWQIVWRGTGTVADADETDIIVGTTHAYCSVSEFSAHLGSTASASEAQMQSVLNAASRWVDAQCGGRRFWLDPVAVARTYEPTCLYELRVDDIGSSSGVIVATDASGDGTFETVWASTDYQLLPYNAPYRGPEAEPWTKIAAIGTQTFPWLSGSYLNRSDRVQITARWGWPAIPEAVTEATKIRAAALFHRKNSPQGIVSFDDFGAVRLGRGEDRDVMSLLAPYRRNPVMVA